MPHYKIKYIPTLLFFANNPGAFFPKYVQKYDKTRTKLQLTLLKVNFRQIIMGKEKTETKMLVKIIEIQQIRRL